MSIVADTHVHLYRCFRLERALDHLTANLGTVNRRGVNLAFLTEAPGCRFHAELREGRYDTQLKRLRVRGDRTPGALQLLREGAPDLILLAGRQLVTAERVEILALATGDDIPHQRCALDTVRAVEDAGGVPVVSWAPGKWFAGRRTVVRTLLDACGPERLLIGDTTLRPLGWGEPRLMRTARRRGFTVLCGSDPLPFGGEEKRLGTYASRWEGFFDTRRPLDSARTLLRSRPRPDAVGVRNGPWQVIRRLALHTAGRRKKSDKR